MDLGELFKPISRATPGPAHAPTHATVIGIVPNLAFGA